MCKELAPREWYASVFFISICREHPALPAGLRAHPDAGVQPAAASVAEGSAKGGARAERELQLRIGHLGAAVAVPWHKTGAPSDPRLAPPLAPLAHNQILLPRTTGWPRCCWLDMYVRFTPAFFIPCFFISIFSTFFLFFSPFRITYENFIYSFSCGSVWITECGI